MPSKAQRRRRANAKRASEAHALKCRLKNEKEQQDLPRRKITRSLWNKHRRDYGRNLFYRNLCNDANRTEFGLLAEFGSDAWTELTTLQDMEGGAVGNAMDVTSLGIDTTNERLHVIQKTCRDTKMSVKRFLAENNRQAGRWKYLVDTNDAGLSTIMQELLRASDMRTLFNLPQGQELDGLTNVLRYINRAGDNNNPTWFALHEEDAALVSVNLCLEGSKLWYLISKHSRDDINKFLFENRDTKVAGDCSQQLLHKNYFIPEETLDDLKVRYVKLLQKPGDLLITPCGSIHQGQNTGRNHHVALNLFFSEQAEDVLQRLYWHDESCSEFNNPKRVNPMHLKNQLEKLAHDNKVPPVSGRPRNDEQRHLRVKRVPSYRRILTVDKEIQTVVSGGHAVWTPPAMPQRLKRKPSFRLTATATKRTQTKNVGVQSET